MQASSVGARLQVRLPEAVRAVHVEVYTHHERPLGVLRIALGGPREPARAEIRPRSGRDPTELALGAREPSRREAAAAGAVRVFDACCAHPGCAGVPAGRGTYASVRVPPSGFLAHRTRALSISTIGRRRSGTGARGGGGSPCAREGANVSIAGIVGLQPPGGKVQFS